MTNWRISDEALAEMGQRIVANSAGAITSFEVAFGTFSSALLRTGSSRS